MGQRTIRGATALERMRTRYETTEKQCPDCGYVSETRSWEGKTDGGRIVYEFVCPRCGAEREHVFEVNR